MPALSNRNEEAASRLVNTSIDDARSSLQYSYQPSPEHSQEKIEENIRILRLALEAEKNGSNRVSLLNLLRSAIRANETAVERNDDPGIGTEPGEVEVVEISTAGPEAPALDDAFDRSPMVHLRFGTKSEFAHHPALASIPMPSQVLEFLEAKKDADRASELAADLAAFRAGVDAAGIIEPLKVVPCPPLLSGEDDGVRWWVVDGRTRLDAAPENEEIPFVEVDPAAIGAIIEATITGRRNWTKTQKAFLAVDRTPELHADRHGQRTDLATSVKNTEVAERYGISLALLEKAIAFYRRYAGKKTLETVRLQVMAGMSFAEINSGTGGRDATKDQPKAGLPVDRAATGLLRWGKTLAGADEWPEAHRGLFAESVEKFWAEAPAAVKAMFREVVEGEGGAK